MAFPSNTGFQIVFNSPNIKITRILRSFENGITQSAPPSGCLFNNAFQLRRDVAISIEFTLVIVFREKQSGGKKMFLKLCVVKNPASRENKS